MLLDLVADLLMVAALPIKVRLYIEMNFFNINN
jgi:hypothetical protein